MHFPILRRWHVFQQTTVHCWMWLKNPLWGFSFFFNCNFSIKSLTAVPFLSVRTPDCTSSLCLLPTTSWDLHYYYFFFFRRIHILQWFKKTTQGRWRAFQTAEFKNERLGLAMPTGWLQTLNLAPSVATSAYTEPPQVSGNAWKCWLLAWITGQGLCYKHVMHRIDKLLMAINDCLHHSSAQWPCGAYLCRKEH